MSAGQQTFESVRDPEEIVEASLPFFAGQGGWTADAVTARQATFSMRVGPSAVPVVFLSLFLLLPGILFAMFYRETLTIAVSSRAGPGGSTTTISWSEGRCRRTCLDFIAAVRRQEPEIAPEPQHTRRYRKIQ